MVFGTTTWPIEPYRMVKPGRAGASYTSVLCTRRGPRQTPNRSPAASPAVITSEIGGDGIGGQAMKVLISTPYRCRVRAMSGWLFGDRKSSSFGVWAAPGARETLPEGGGQSPPPFWRVSKAPGAAQTLKLDDFRSPKNQPDIALRPRSVSLV